jgi:hypothetical protein
VPAEPLELVISGRVGSLPVAYACAVCGTLFTIGKRDGEEDRVRKKDEAARHCDRACECGNHFEFRGYTKCRPCLDQIADDKEAALHTKATKLEADDYNDPVYWEGHVGGLGDGYFSGVDEVLEYCEDEDIPPPEYVWACSSKEFELDAHAFLEREVDRQELFEDAFDQIGQTRIDSMQAYFNEWTASLDLTTWGCDYSRAVLLTPAPSNDHPHAEEN